MIHTKLKTGELWYVQFMPKATLVKLEIVELTDSTVLLKDPKIQFSPYNLSRYRISDVEFIEVIRKIEEK